MRPYRILVGNLKFAMSAYKIDFMQMQLQCQSKIDYYVVGVDLLNAICVSFAAVEWISYDSKYHITHIFSGLPQVRI